MKLEKFVKKNFATYLAYAISTIAVVALARLFNVGSEFVSLYWPIAFFAVAGLDFYKSQVVEGGASEVRAYACTPTIQSPLYVDQWGVFRVDYFGSPRRIPAALPADPATEAMCSQPRSLGDNYTDRFLGYIFTAPFILPVKLYQAFTR